MYRRGDHVHFLLNALCFDVEFEVLNILICLTLARSSKRASYTHSQDLLWSVEDFVQEERPQSNTGSQGGLEHVSIMRRKWQIRHTAEPVRLLNNAQGLDFGGLGVVGKAFHHECDILGFLEIINRTDITEWLR